MDTFAVKDESPRTLTALFGAAKDTSELMLDLAYAAVLYDDPEVAEEVVELEHRLADLVQAMREVCLLAARGPSDAASLASFLRLTDAITTLGDSAVDIAKVVTRHLGLPAAMRVSLVEALEVTDRIPITASGELAGADVAAAETRVAATRVLAVRRLGEWAFDPASNTPLEAGDVLLARGSTQALNLLRLAAGVPVRELVSLDDSALTALDQAIDTVVQMKNLAEVAVALAYATVLVGDPALARHVDRLEDELDGMREAVERWVLSAATRGGSTELRGLLHLAVTAETIGDGAQAMVWPVERGEVLHPVVADALRASEDSVAVIDLVDDGNEDGVHLARTLRGRAVGDEFFTERGISVIAVRRNGKWNYRPPAGTPLLDDDRVILIGPTSALA